VELLVSVILYDQAFFAQIFNDSLLPAVSLSYISSLSFHSLPVFHSSNFHSTLSNLTMYASSIIVFALSALTATATPVTPSPLLSLKAYCPGKYFVNPQCCSTNVGVAAFDCKIPTGAPSSLEDFKSTCSAEKKDALCCLIPLVCSIG
jgi:hypothetical protein